MSGNPARILLVDDDCGALESLARALKPALKSALPDCLLDLAASKVAAQKLLAENDFSAAVLDLSLNREQGVESGFDLLRHIVSSFPLCRNIVLTGHASVEHGIRALQLGAAHFLEKPPNIALLAALISDGVAQSVLRRRYADMMAARPSEAGSMLVGNSAKIAAVREAVRQAARTNQAVFLCGETGSGKGLAALSIHRLSSRNRAKFVRYQPNFSTADLVNSELFGHVKGAFTGADSSRKGLLAEANGGTFFLDEVDELPGETQVTLLGVLQERRFRALGSSEEQETDFRLITASNQDIRVALDSGKLRSDLYHRFARLVIELPPLRERLEDVPVLAAHILGMLRDSEKVNVFDVSPEAVGLLQSHIWPGNVRELESVVESAAYRAQFAGRVSIIEQDIKMILKAVPSQGGTESLYGTGFLYGTGSFHEQVEDFKRKIIKEALRRHQGNQARAAKELGLDRSNMRRILARVDRV